MTPIEINNNLPSKFDEEAALLAVYKVLQQGGLSLPDFLTLRELEAKPVTLTGLSALLGVTPAAITDRADRLETRGFVLRRRDASDRRLVYLEITPKGRALLAVLRN